MTAVYLESPPECDTPSIDSTIAEPTEPTEEDATIDSHITSIVQSVFEDDTAKESATESEVTQEPPKVDANGNPLPTRESLIEKAQEQHPDIPKWFIELTVDNYLYQLVKGIVPME